MLGLVLRGAGLAARMRARTIAVQHFLSCRTAGGGGAVSADADVVKDVVCTNNVRGEKGRGRKLEGPENGRDNPQVTVEEPGRSGECL